MSLESISRDIARFQKEIGNLEAERTKKISEVDRLTEKINTKK